MNKAKFVALCTLSCITVLVGCSGKISGDIPDGDGAPKSGTEPSASNATSGSDPSAPSTGSGSAGTSEPSQDCFTADLGAACSDPNGKAKDLALAICASSGAEPVGLSLDPAGRCEVSCCRSWNQNDPGYPGPPGKPGYPGKPGENPGDPGKPPAPDPSSPYPTPTPPDPGKPVPDPPGANCNHATFGDGITCIPAADIGSRASLLCTAIGGALSSLQVMGQCTGGVLFGKVECCSPSPSPVPPFPPSPGTPR
jgi:hypothetical protein